MNAVIAIRVDGNSEIGFGHLMRMKALACELDRLGAKVIFLSRNPENIEGYRVLSLDKATAEAEDLRVEETLENIGAGMLVIDSYDYGRERLNRAGQLDLLSVYIDDLNRHPFNTDIVVNGNLYAPGLDYRGKAEFLLGSRYLLMREDFTGLAGRVAAPQVKSVLLTFGAADLENLTPGILRILKNYEKFQHLQWHVAVGPVFRNVAEIEAAAKDCSNVFLHFNPNIKNLMDICDICISAAGSTAYELAACGVPSLLVICAGNQVMLAKEAQRQGLGVNLGWHHELDGEDLYGTLDNLITDGELRVRMAMRGQEIIDGRGAQRTAAILLRKMRENK